MPFSVRNMQQQLEQTLPAEQQCAPAVAVLTAPQHSHRVVYQ
jgi:hypothetical protein